VDQPISGSVQLYSTEKWLAQNGSAAAVYFRGEKLALARIQPYSYKNLRFSHTVMSNQRIERRLHWHTTTTC